MAAPSLAQAFLDRSKISGVAYHHNDYVHVVGGSHAGSAGSLVTILALLPELRFVIELESGFDVEVLQSQIQMGDA